jgi:hypothetical protein
MEIAIQEMKKILYLVEPQKMQFIYLNINIIHTYICIYIYIYIHTHTHIYIHTHICIYLYHSQLAFMKNITCQMRDYLLFNITLLCPPW